MSSSLVARLPRKLRIACFLISHGLMLWCCWLIWQGSWIQTMLQLEQQGSHFGNLRGHDVCRRPVASACMALILLVNLWRSLRGELPATWSGKDRFADLVPAIKEKRP